MTLPHRTPEGATVNPSPSPVPGIPQRGSALERGNDATGRWPNEDESLRNACQLEPATAEEMADALERLQRTDILWLTMPREEAWGTNGRMCALKRFLWELGPRRGGIGIYHYFLVRCGLTAAQVDSLTHLYDSARTRVQGRALVIRELRAHIQAVAVLQQGPEAPPLPHQEGGEE